MPDPAGRDDRPKPGRKGFTSYCAVIAMLATTGGAAVSLVGGEAVVKFALWGVVLLVVTVAAGWWWASAPATAHRWTVGLLVRPAARGVPTRMPSRKS
jgi:hypothetical protein